MFIDKLFNEVSASALKTVCLHKNVYIWGDSQFNKHIFEVIPPELFKGIFDNNDNKWGQYSSGLQIQKFVYEDDIVVVSAIVDIFSLIAQLKNLKIDNYFFYRTQTLYEQNEKIEAEFYAKSTNKFLPNKVFKYLHIIPDKNFILPMLDIIKKGFCLKEHAFLIYAFNRDNPNDIYDIWETYLQLELELDNVLIYDGIFLCDDFSKKRRAYADHIIQKCNRFIFHGELFSVSVGELFLHHINMVRKKGIFIPWSGEFDKHAFYMPYIKSIFRHCPIVVLGQYGKNRLDEILRNCKFSNLHIFSEPISYTQVIDRPQKEKHARPKVFVAHSCYEYNKAIESIQCLKKFSDSIDVYCIGSYGNSGYTNKVWEYGNRVLGKAFHMITTFMSYKEYVKFLATMDVAVMAMEVGCGMTTVRILCYVGCKLYFKKYTTTAAYADARGYKWYNIDNIEGESIDEFCRNEYEEDNYENVKFEFELNDKVSKWHRLLEMNI